MDELLAATLEKPVEGKTKTKSAPPPRPWRYIQSVASRGNFKHVRVHTTPSFVLYTCNKSEEACLRCHALREALRILPSTWDIETKQDRQSHPRLLFRDPDSGETKPIRFYANSENPKTMRNAVTARFRSKRIFRPMPHQVDLAMRIPGRFLVDWQQGSGKTLGSAFALRSQPRVLVVAEVTLLAYWLESFTDMGIQPLVPIWDLQFMGYQKADSMAYDHSDLLVGRALVIDECQVFRGYHRSSKFTKGFMNMMAPLEVLLELSGTPLVNSVLDTLYLLKTLAPEEPVTLHLEEVVESKDVPLDGTVLSRLQKGFDDSTILHAFLHALAGKVHHFSPKEFQPKRFLCHYPRLVEPAPVLVPMTWPQCFIYFFENDKMTIDINGLQIQSGTRKTGVLSKLATISAVDFDGDYWSSKTDAIVREAVIMGPGVSQVIYSSLKKRSLQPILRRLQEDYPEFEVALLDGDVATDGSRTKMLKSYLAGDIDILLICKVGAVGLDLKSTSALYLVEPQANRPTEEQIIARAVRYNPHEPDPDVVTALRFLGTFPGPKDKPTPEEKQALRQFVGKMKPVIQDAFGRGSRLKRTQKSQQGGLADEAVLDGVVLWLREQMKERGTTADQDRYAMNQAKYQELLPFIQGLKMISVYQPKEQKPPQKRQKVTAGPK